MQLNPSLHENFISDKIVLKCVKTHDSRIDSMRFVTSKWAIGHSVQNTVWSILSISIPNPSTVDLSGSVDGVLDWGIKRLLVRESLPLCPLKGQDIFHLLS